MAQRSILLTGTNAQLDKGDEAIAWKFNYDSKKLLNETKTDFLTRQVKEIINNAIKEKKRFDRIVSAEAKSLSDLPEIT